MTNEQIEANKAKLAECYGKEYTDKDGDKVIVVGIKEDGNPIIEYEDTLFYTFKWAELTEIKEPSRIWVDQAGIEKWKTGYAAFVDFNKKSKENFDIEFIELTPEIKGFIPSDVRDRLGIK